MPELNGYVSFSLKREDGSSRGLTTYTHRSIPVTFQEKGVTEGIEYVIVCLTILGIPIYFINTYVSAGCFRVENLPEYVFTDPSVLMGDLNARHKDLGSFLTSNANGIRWKAFLDAADHAALTGDNVFFHTC